MVIIAIDPATVTGVTHGSQIEDLKTLIIDCNVKPATKKRPKENEAIRVYRLYLGVMKIIQEYLEKGEEIVLAYESSPSFTRGKAAANVAGELRGVLKLISMLLNLKTYSPTANDLKRWATGSQTADKPTMIATANSRGYVGNENNEADSYLLWIMCNEFKTSIK